MANELVLKAKPYARDILKRQEKLRSVWTILLDYTESRAKKLLMAEELHKFNRDVAEITYTLKEKRNTMPTDLGPGPKQVEALIQKHNIFTNECKELQKQLYQLIEEGGRLRKEYPTNADNINEQIKLLAELWDDLEKAANHRHIMLAQSYDLQRFLGLARDFVSWTDNANAEMRSDNERMINDLQNAELMRKEHSRLKLEIEGREKEFVEIQRTAAVLLEKKHYGKKEIEDKLNQVLVAYEHVKHEWELRDKYLHQVVQFHSFTRDVRTTIAAIQTRQTTLQSFEIGNTVEAVESQIRQFETFTKVLSQLSERVALLEDAGQTLIRQEHMEVSRIEANLKRVHAALDECRTQHNDVHRRLQAALQQAKFEDDLTDLDLWINDKLKRLTAQLNEQSKTMSLEEKLDNLKRQQALEIEVNANQSRINAIGTHLTKLRHSSANKALEQKAEGVLRNWDRLIAVSKQLAKALEEARDLFEFNQAVERVHAWVREKQLLLNANDMGNDLEHCQILLDRLTGKHGDQSIDDRTLQEINRLGHKLMKPGSENATEIETKLRELNETWSVIHGRMDAYRISLEAALAVHRFNRDVEETNTRIHEKAALLSTEDYGKDLSSVEALLRKQDTIERDMSAIHKKLNSHDQEAKELLTKDPPLRNSIIVALTLLEGSWKHLADLAHSRRQRLEQSFNLHKYFDAVKKTESWANGISVKMTSYVRPRSVADAEALIASHAEKQGEIVGHEQELKNLSELGQEIAVKQPDHKAEINRAHRRLQNIEHQIRQTWETERVTLAKLLKLQILSAQITLTESWIASKEAVIGQYDAGDSIDAVESLIKKHDAFEKTIKSQGSEKIQQLKEHAVILEDSNDHEAEMVKSKYDEVLSRYENLLENCHLKRRNLEDSRKLHDFIRTCGELITWMNSRLQLAYDNDYIDPTNLRSKLQKHLAAEAELVANENRIEEIKAVGYKLISSNHIERERIRMQLNEVISGWEELKSKSAKKTKLLKESYEAYQMSRKLDDIEKWLDGIEHTLSTDDHGRDTQSVEKLIKKHDELRAEVEAKRPLVHEVTQKAAEMKEKNYENFSESFEHSGRIQERYDGLKEPCQIRADNLQDSLKYFQWMDEAQEQTDWLNELIPRLQSSDYGSTLHAAQSLNKKHAILEQEITSRAPIISQVKINGTEMKNAGHFATGEIEKILHTLTHQFDTVQRMSKERAHRLAESLLSQEFYAEANEADAWMRERMPLVNNQEVGNNEVTAEAHLRRLIIIDGEIKQFKDEITRLRKISDKLVRGSHFDSTQITTTQARIEEYYSKLENECRNRKKRLHDASEYYKFVRQVDDLSEWLREKQRHAMRDDYGRDLEDCQALIEQFEQVYRELSSAGEKVHAIGRKQEELLHNNNPFSSSIRAQGSELQQLWREVNEAANDQQQALLDAKNIHIFDQEADEMLNRLGEKEAQIVSLQGEDLTSIDLEMVNRFVQTHEEFLRGLFVVEKQVGELCREADRMIQQFPRTQEHLEVRRLELEEQLKDIRDEARKFQDRLTQAQNNQAYFHDHRDLMAWIRQMQTTIIAEILPHDLMGCEALSVRHNEYRAEIATREPQKVMFVQMGQKMVSSGNALSNEIRIKIEDLESGFRDLIEIWEARRNVYEMNFDVQQWLHQAAYLEKWLVEREGLLKEDWRTVDSVETVEDMIRQFEDFLVTLDAQKGQFDAVRRITKVEEQMATVRNREQEIINRRESVAENRRDTQQIKTLEKKKILQEKRQERERRKTQEISIIKRTPSQEAAPEIVATTLPRARNRASSTGSHENVLISATISQLPTSSTSSRQDVEILRRSSELLAGSSVPMGKTPGFTTRRTQSIKRSSHEASHSRVIDMHG